MTKSAGCIMQISRAETFSEKKNLVEPQRNR